MTKPLKKKEGKKSKKIQYKDDWVLYHELVQIHWVNDVAAEVEVGGKLFKATVPTRK